MFTRRLLDRTETYTQIIKGACSCGNPVDKVINSDCSIRADKVRYCYPKSKGAWNVFRCEKCQMPIDDSFVQAPD